VLEELVPPPVAVAEWFGDKPDGFLFPEEAAVIGQAVDKRRREFTTVRACARQALRQLGVAPVPILPGERGAPQWPSGVVGSMTHCDGYRATAVALVADIGSIGIDAEPNRPLPDGVLGLVSLPDERTMLAGLPASPAGSGVQAAPGGASPGTAGPCWDRLLFSAKESVYKAWFPLTRRWLSFKEAAVIIGPADGTFTARLLVPGPVVNSRPLSVFEGRWLARDGILVTVVTVPAG
jgi:4'-phosphopantetheinyl transferase EntD